MKDGLAGRYRVHGDVHARVAVSVTRWLAEQLRECGLEPFSGSAGVFDAVEEAAIGVEREARVGMAELATDVDDVNRAGQGCPGLSSPRVPAPPIRPRYARSLPHRSL